MLLSIENSRQHWSSPSVGVHGNLDTPALPTECEISKVTNHTSSTEVIPRPLPEQAIWKCCDADVEFTLFFFQFHQIISSSFSNFPTTAVLDINGNMCTCGLLVNHICAVISIVLFLICALYCHFLVPYVLYDLTNIKMWISLINVASQEPRTPQAVSYK